MTNFFLILLNRTFYNPQDTQDRIFECSSDIYSDIKYYREELIDDHTRLHAFIEKSCSITKFSKIDSNILPKSVIFPSNVNDIINVITHYNDTYFQYEKITLNNTEDPPCSINNNGWSDWISNSFQEIYKMICTYGNDYYNNACINQYNPNMANTVAYTFEKINNLCYPTTTINLSTSGSINTANNYFNHNITNTTNDDSHFNTHDFSNTLIYWTQMVAVGAGIFTIGYYTKKIIDYIHKQCCTPNTNDNIELQSLQNVQVIENPKEAIQMSQTEHSVEEPLYENVSTIGNIE
jgi:hypothetical protein